MEGKEIKRVQSIGGYRYIIVGPSARSIYPLLFLYSLESCPSQARKKDGHGRSAELKRGSTQSASPNL